MSDALRDPHKAGSQTGLAMAAEVLTLQSERQQLQLVPQLGGGVALWNWNTAQGPLPLLRPWDGSLQDPGNLACFPLLPWSNRITQGGFAHQGVHYAVRENRAGEPYPIHGDAWQQAWRVQSHTAQEVVIKLESRRHNDNPHEYDAQQRFSLLEDGLRITLKLTHRNRVSLLYGLGFSPCFVFDADSRLQAAASGVWLSGPDPIPIAHSSTLPPGWDFSEPAPLAAGQPLDNCFTGWDGEMRLSRPREHLMLVMRIKENSGYYVLQRCAGARYFSFQPVTHPIDAFHSKSRPGLVALANGESVLLEMDLRVEELDQLA
jgi:aldose 1-epimerase